MTPLQKVSRAGAIGALVFALVFAAAGAQAQREIQVIQTVTTGPAGPQGQGPMPMSSVQQNGTGLIVGQVVEAGSDRGVAGALVTLGGAQPGGPTRVTMTQVFSRDGEAPVVMSSSNASVPRLITDSEGRFAFRNLPKGVFNITATKPGYLDGAYGRLRPNGTSQSIELAEDERTGDVQVRLFKPAAIGGTVLDDIGEPVVGVQIRAYRRSLVAGRRLLTAAVGTATTDDRGVYRLANLIPGEYVVALQTQQSSMPGSLHLDGPLAADLLATMTSGGGSGMISLSSYGTLAAGDNRFTLQPNNSALAGPSGPLVYPSQYYPSSPDVSRATPVSLTSGEERSGIDLHLKLVPTITVSGRLMGPDGAAPNYALHLVPSDTGDLSTDPNVATTVTDSNGEFQFLGVPAGQYVIQTSRMPRGLGVSAERYVFAQGAGGGSATYSVNTAGSAGAGWVAAPPQSAPGQTALWLALPVSVAGTDINNLLLTLRTGLKVSGRIEFDGAAERPPAERINTISVSVESADGKQRAAIPAARVDPNGQFTVQGLLPGKYLLRVANAPGGWTFKGASNSGVDIADTPFEVEDRDITGVTLTFFDRPSELRGTVRSSRGTPDDGAAVVVFPADTRSWMNYGVNPRRMRMARTSKTGAFTFGALPAGDYFAIAISDEVAGEWQDPQFLDLLSRSAQRVTLGEGQKNSQDLATQNVRPPGGDPAPVADPDSDRDGDAGVGSGHGPFVAEPAQTQSQTQTQSRDTRPQTPARDTAATTAAGTATLAGVLTLDDPSPQPVRRARVTARSADGRTERAGATDDAGRFAIGGLPPGHYTLMAAKASYLQAFYGSKRPGRGPGIPIALAAGQSLNNLSIKMARGGVVSGVVRDDYGLPVASAVVRVLQFRTINGERTLTAQQSAMTDDRGIYRVFGLAPATYVVSAMPPANVAQSEIRQLSNADLQAAMSDLQRPAQPAAASNPQAATAGTGAQSRPVGRTVGFAPVYYPGTLVQAEATQVSVAAGQELTAIDIPIRLVATARVEGSVTGADGRPATGVSLHLVAAEQGQTASLNPKFTNSNNEGKFSFVNVPPGRYALTARGGGGAAGMRLGGDFFTVAAIPMPAGAPPPPPPPPTPHGLGATLYAAAEVDVNGENVTDISLALQDTMTVTGRVVFAGKTLAPPANLARTRVALVPLASAGVTMGMPDAAVDATGAFKITGVAPGKYRMTASIPGGGSFSGGSGAAGGWALRSAVMDGRDVLDTALDIRAGQSLQNMVVTFTDQPTELSGTLVDGAGKPMAGFAIVVFSTDRATWSSGSRRISPAIQVSSDGKYRAAGLPPGEYFLAALTDYEQGDLGDASFLEQVAAVAMKVTLGEGEKKVQDLKIAGS